MQSRKFVGAATRLPDQLLHLSNFDQIAAGLLAILASETESKDAKARLIETRAITIEQRRVTT